jgi:hypothetical protein
MSDAARPTSQGSPGIIERFKRYLPVTERTPMVSLGEG